MGKLITVCDGAGSIHPSVLAANLACAFAARAKTKTLLMSSPVGNVNEWDILLHVSPEKSLDDLMALYPSLNAALLSGFLTRHAMGISVVGSSRRTALDPAVFNRVLAALVEAHDWTVLSLSGHTPLDIADAVLSSSQHIVIPVHPDLLNVQYAAAYVTGLKRRHIDARAYMPLATDTGMPGLLDNDQVKKILSLPVYARIPCDSAALAESVAAGIPPVLGHPSGQFARGVIGWMEKLVLEPSTGVPAQPAAQGDGMPDEQAVIPLKQAIHAALVRELKNTTADTPPEILRERARAVIAEMLAAGGHAVSRDARPRLIDEVLDEAFGLGCLEEFVNDPAVTEIMVNGPDSVYIEKKGKIHHTGARFTSARQLMTVIDRIVAPIGRRVDESSPLVDARLSDGSRVNAVIPPVSLTGPVLTIRKFSRQTLSVDDLISLGALSPAMAEYLRVCVLLRKNIVISGGTGSGKTTLLNVISSFIPSDERIVTIEDSAELRLPQTHVVRLEARPPSMEGKGEILIRRLVVNALRMRPDRIIVGECRAGETLDMLQAMNTGHDGSLTTLHANTPRDAIARLTTMVIMAGTDLPERAVREQIAAAIDVIIQLSRMPDGSRKIVAVTEVGGIGIDGIEQVPIFSYERAGMHEGKVLGRFTASGNVSGFLAETAARGLHLDSALFHAGAPA